MTFSEFRTHFIYHAARAFFASAWADACEEAGQSASLSGCDIMEAMPGDIDPAAIHAANTLYADLERANGCRHLRNIFEENQSLADGDRDYTVELFGHYCAMQAMGHGVGLSDAFGSGVRANIQVPYIEFGSYSLEHDYF